MRKLWESLKLLSLFLWPSRDRSVSVYELLGKHNNLAKQSRFLNLGYWKQATDYDQACRDLALLVAERAELSPQDELLDVGCGFGEQDALWMERFGPKQITAINIVPLHLEYARTHFAHPQIEFKQASATALPFENQRFDKIIALESAFHFNTREDFFKEAWRVLKPGGRLVLADSLPYKTPKSPFEWFQTWLFSGLWQVPLANSYDPDTCRQKLQSIGFEAVEIEDISAEVWLPFKRYAQARVQDPEIRQRVHPWLRNIWGNPNLASGAIAYVLIEARKGN